jgi:hypothetical protein
MRAAVAAIAAVVVLSAGSTVAAAPSSLQLVFEGKHNSQLLHDGTFTASSSYCSVGTAADVATDEATLTATRQFTCNAGGTFTAKVNPLPAEHGGNGTWQIVSGSGPLADLRGKGTFTSVRTGGDPSDPETITFRSTWIGVADLDATPPVTTVTHWHLKKLKHPKRTYTVKIALSLTDNGGGAVSYALELADSKKPSNALVYKAGKTTSGTVSKSFRIKVGKHTRRLRLKVDIGDEVGNESSFTKTYRLK